MYFNAFLYFNDYFIIIIFQFFDDFLSFIPLKQTMTI
jgi:hypothetical protein